MPRTVTVKYGVGYGEHRLEIDVEDDATPEEIEEMATMAVQERLWVSIHDDEAAS